MTVVTALFLGGTLYFMNQEGDYYIGTNLGIIEFAPKATEGQLIPWSTFTGKITVELRENNKATLLLDRTNKPSKFSEIFEGNLFWKSVRNLKICLVNIEQPFDVERHCTNRMLNNKLNFGY